MRWITAALLLAVLASPAVAQTTCSQQAGGSAPPSCVSAVDSLGLAAGRIVGNRSDGSTTDPGATIAAGTASIYNAAGPVLGQLKLWIGTATTDSNGNWSVSFAASGVGFGTIGFVAPTVMSTAQGASVGSYSVTMTAPTTSGVAGTVVKPNTAILGVLASARRRQA